MAVQRQPRTVHSVYNRSAVRRGDDCSTMIDSSIACGGLVHVSLPTPTLRDVLRVLHFLRIKMVNADSCSHRQ